MIQHRQKKLEKRISNTRHFLGLLKHALGMFTEQRTGKSGKRVSELFRFTYLS